MFSADRARHLQNLFLSESWEGRFKTLSDTIGFNLRIYSEDGNPIFSTEEHYPMCRGLLSAPDFRSKCYTYCHNTMMEAFSKCHSIIYELLLENVDKALCLAKDRGGNRIEVFS
ncbi:MAG: hypothetical protein NTW44_00690 [Nitrospirae bacterium]|nr:hypothetical protein [Nitrospirota bacterium]